MFLLHTVDFSLVVFVDYECICRVELPISSSGTQMNPNERVFSGYFCIVFVGEITNIFFYFLLFAPLFVPVF